MKTHFRLFLRLAAFVVIALTVQITLSRTAFAETEATDAGVTLKLPSTPVSSKFVQNFKPPGGNSFFNVTLLDVPGGVDIANGDYLGWCADPYSGYEFEQWTENVTLYSTYDPNLPANVKDKNIPWDKINYLLNHKNGQPNNVVQAALWYLEAGDRNAWIPGWDCAAGSACDALVQDANANGSGFVPGPGQVLAVFQYYNGITRKDQPNDGWQDTIIEVPLGKLGDFVWNDGNANGLQDNNEPGIANVQVNLLDPGADGQCNSGNETLIQNTFTNNNGFYQFIVVTPRNYCVEFKAPPDFVFSPPNRGNGANDSKANQTTGQTIQPAFVPKGGENLNQDAGLYPATQPPRFTLGDRVWYDQNKNGVQDANEPSYPGGLSVKLYNNIICTEPAISSTTSDGNGFYQFSGLSAGIYSVKFSGLPTGWGISPRNLGDDTKDSDANSAGCIENINLTANDPNEDIGIYIRGSLGDNVMCVSTGQPLPNITVNLFKDFDANGQPDGSAIASQQTDGAGFYRFIDLEVALAGSANQTKYIVQVDAGDPDLGACNEPIPPTSYNPKLDSSKPNDPNNDFKFQKPVQPALLNLGDRVWYDQNKNGVQDANEPSYNGATLQLFNNATCSDPAINNTTSGGSGPAGFYQFSNLSAGTYSVKISNLPAGWKISPAEQGNDAQNSDANTAGCIENINLTANDPNEDIGIYVPGTLGDTVKCETTGQPLPNIGVFLFKDFNGDGQPDGSAISEKQTDGNGFYQFTNLEVALAGDLNNQTKYLVRVNTADPDLGTCNIAMPPTSYNPKLDSNKPNDPNNDFKFQKPLVCGLAVDQKCQIASPPPSTSWSCSDAKPLDRVSMVWNGTQTVSVKAWKGSVGSALLATINDVTPGEIVNVTGYAGSPNDVIWEVFVGGSKIGQSTFHLSCSDDTLDGPEDCGSAQGDGKRNDPAYLNLWKLEGLGGNGQSFSCTSTPPTPTDSCTFTPSNPSVCNGKTKPKSLTFRYTGGSCGDSTNPQSGKFQCSGSPGADPVTIRILKDANKFSISPSSVKRGEEFTITAVDSFPADTLLSVGGQSLTIHTSCSQALNVGDVFGSLVLVGANGQTINTQVTFKYLVSNTGDNLSNVTLRDNFGQIDGIFALNKGESKNFERKTTIAQTTDNVAIVKGVLASGQACEARDTTRVVAKAPVLSCADGKPVALVFEYTGGSCGDTTNLQNGKLQCSGSPGSDPVSIAILKDADKISVSPSSVSTNQQFSIVRNDGKELAADTMLRVGGQSLTIHTSCSQALNVGDVFGSLRLVRFVPKGYSLTAAATDGEDGIVRDILLPLIQK
jgi:hypothetical protein